MGRREKSGAIPAALPPPVKAPAAGRAPRPYRAYQITATAYAAAYTHPALLLEMRLGKTLIPLRAAGPGRYLVVAPGSALKSWEDELAKENVPSADVSILLGPRKTRLALLTEGRRWNLINREGWRVLPEIAAVPWAGVVFDESTAAKNPRAQITRFFLQNFRSVPRRWILTGTVNPESDLDIWCQFAFLDLPRPVLGCRTYWEFQARYYRPSITGYGWVPRRGTPEAIRSFLGERAFILSRKDAGADVPKVYERRRVGLPPALRKVYDRIEADFVSADGARETKTAATVYHWLRQLCGGFDGEKLIWPGKLNELVELLTGELARDPVVVWFYYNRELHAAEAALRKAGVTVARLEGVLNPAARRKAIDAFQTGKARALLAQQAVAQMGADFSRADTAIYYSTPCGALARRQTEDRILKIERKTPLLILDLVVPGTVDEDAVDMVQDKAARGAWTLERARIRAARRTGGTEGGGA